MAIYISKDAIKKVPDLNPEENYLPKTKLQLRATLFKKSTFFNNLAGQTNGAYFITEGTTSKEVGSLKVALRIVNTILNINDIEVANVSYTTGINKEVFGSKTKEMLVKIQTNNELEVTGYLNQETLMFLDNAIFNVNIKDYEDGTVHNEDGHLPSNKNRKFVVFENDSGTIKANKSPFVNESTDLENILYGEQFDDINDFFVANLEDINDYNERTDSFVKFIQKEGVTVLEVAPKPEPNAELHKVKSGETLASVIRDKYYKEAYPLGDSRFVFPARDMKPDTRLRYMVNMLYYFNAPDREYAGMKSQDDFARYSYDDLDAVNIFNNDSYTLNYAEFVKSVETIGAGNGRNYGWSFDNSMNPPIELIEGEYIWLPSRTFVESTYYHLNFKPEDGKMYQENTNDIGISSFDWISQEGFDNFIEEVTTGITGLGDDLLTDIIDVYKEAREFFMIGYSWAIQLMEDYWPRGAGAHVAGGLGITVPIFLPVAGDVTGENYMWRLFTADDALTFKTHQKIIGSAGLDFGVGVGITATLGAGKGNRKTAAFGAGVEIGASAKIFIESILEHEYPVTKDNTAIVSMIISYAEKMATKGLLVSHSVEMLKYFEVINLDPAQYLVKSKLSTSFGAQVWGNAYLGVVGEEEDQWGLENTGSIGRGNVSWLNFDNIWWLFKRLGVGSNASGGFGMGYEMKYEAKYDDLPIIHKLDGRVPKTVEVETAYFVEANVNIGSGTNKLFESMALLAGFLGITNFNFANLFFDSFNFQKGLALKTGLEYTRKKKASEHAFNNESYISSKDIVISNAFEEIKKTTSIEVFSGDTDAIGMPGTELAFSINIAKLQELVNVDVDGNDGPTLPTLDDIFTLFDTVKYKKHNSLIEYEKNHERNKALANNMNQRTQIKFEKNDQKSSSSNNGGSSNRRLTNGNKINTFIKKEATFKFETILNASKFVLNYLRIVASRAQLADDADSFDVFMEQLNNQFALKTTALVNAISDDTVEEINCDVEALFDQMLQDSNDFITNNSLAEKLVPITEVFPIFIETLDIEGGLTSVHKKMKIPFNTLVDKFSNTATSFFKMAILHIAKTFDISFSVGAELARNAALEFKFAAVEKLRLSVSIGAGLYLEVNVLNKGEPSALFDPDDEYINEFISIVKTIGGTLIDSAEFIFEVNSDVKDFKELLMSKVHLSKTE